MGEVTIYPLEPICPEEGNGWAAVAGDLTIMSETQNLEGGPLIRMHSACRYSEIYESDDCDCAAQLKDTMAKIALEGQGILFYLDQEGRGAGLSIKAEGYRLSQEHGLTTAEAYEHMKVPFDSREYGHCARFLLNNGIQRVRLLSNNPWKIDALTEYGIEVSRQTHISGVTEHNIDYLRVKRDIAGHAFPPDLEA